MNYLLGSKISVNTISPSVLGVGINNEILVSILTYEEARKLNPSLYFTNIGVFNSIHIVSIPDVTKMVFIKVSSDNIYAIDWLKTDTLEVNSDIPLLRINIPNGTQVLVETIDELFTTAGILSFNIDLLKDLKTEALLVKIELSYASELIRQQAVNIIRGINITDFTYEIFK